MKQKVAMLIMIDGAMVDERYFEIQIPSKDDWITKEEEPTEALWFFY